MKPRPWRERALVGAVALHSVAIGVVLLLAPRWGLAFAGFDAAQASFFTRQAGIFHFVVAGGYLLEHLRYGGVSFLVATKTLAALFLVAETAGGGAAWSIPLSALGDLLMAVAVLAVRLPAGR